MTVILPTHKHTAFPHLFDPFPDRPDILARLCLRRSERADIKTLFELYGPKAALRAVLRVRRSLKTKLAVIIHRGRNVRWLYDINHHLMAAYALRRETALARVLLAVYRGGR